MFCYQRGFNNPTRVISAEQFWALVKAPETAQKVKEAREALAKGDKATYDRKKKGLPLMIFVGTFEESERTFEDKKTGEKRTVKEFWRNQAHVRLNGLVVADYDHLEGDVRKVWEEAYAKLSDEDKARILLVFITPSGHGLKVVFMADPNIGNLIDNQWVMSYKLGFEVDDSCKDGCRGAFQTTDEDIIFINEEKLFTYENEEFGKKFNDSYHAGNSQPTISLATDNRTDRTEPAEKVVESCSPLQENYNGVEFSKIIEAWLEGVNLDNNRHNTLTELASHLRYLIGKNPKKITEVVMQQPWVQDLSAEGEDVAGTVASVMGWRYNQKMPEQLQKALEKTGACSDPQPPSLGGSGGEDVYASLPLDKWAGELQEMAEVYPCMKELFLNAHPHKLPAILFSSAALFGTLMTRAWYHFWYEQLLHLHHR